MADILPFRRPRSSVKQDGAKASRAERSSQASNSEKPGGDTLCRNGHHKWEVDTAKQFDVKAGRLVTAYRCSRCGKVRVRAH